MEVSVFTFTCSSYLDINFFYNKHKICDIWCIFIRSTLPQHFDTFNGHYNYREGTECSLKRRKPPNGNASSVIQKYNRAVQYGFDKYCSSKGSELPNSEEVKRDTEGDQIEPLSLCSIDHLQHTCTLDMTSVKYRTVYKMLIDNNLTEGLGSYKENPVKTARILRWNIADIFDVPQWHVLKTDCSHFCYVPP